MSSTTGRPGRPPGPSPETLAKGRHFLSLVDYGVSESVIAAREGISVSDVYRAINIVRPLAAVDSKPARDPERKPQKMPEGTLLRRAFAAIRNVRAFKGLLDAETREFWVEALIEIRALADDGTTLTFGEPGDVYHSQDEFLSVFDGIAPTQLEKLFRHAMLVDLSGAGVALPYRWGFRDGPNAPARRASKVPVSRPQPVLEAVAGGLSDSERTPIYSELDSERTPIYSESPQPINSESPSLTHAATAAANAETDQCLKGSSSSIGSPAGDSELIAGFSEKTPLPDSERTPAARSSLAVLTIELMALAKIARPPNADDLGAVRGWLDAGYAPDDMRGVIEAKTVQRGNKPPPTSLVYFNGPMHQALGSKSRPEVPAALPDAPVPAAPPLSEAEKAAADARQKLHARVYALMNHYVRHDKAGPCPPLPSQYEAHCNEGRGIAAGRWLTALEAFNAAKQPDDVSLPPFEEYMADPAALEAVMLACEETLTAPDKETADG